MVSNTEFLAYQKATWDRVREYDWTKFHDETKREFEYLNIIGAGALPSDKANEVYKHENMLGNSVLIPFRL